MTCPLETPNCKRMLMSNNKPFEKKQCPLNIKPRCALSPPACPLLPQSDNTCGYAKLMGGDVKVDQCPCKTCFLAEGCPISLNPCPNIVADDTNKDVAGKWPENIPPCLVCNDANAPTKVNSILVKTDWKSALEKAEKQQSDKIGNKLGKSQIVTKCPLISSPRPLPCSECILQELSAEIGFGRKIKPCPYLAIPNVCGQNCYCPDVPSVDTGPLCPFAPKPCPCCATPRCPLSRQPDCILNPKPPCCLQSPKCGMCCPPRCPSLSPCCCGLCAPCCKPLCDICVPGPAPCCPTTTCISCGCGSCALVSGPCPLVNPCVPCLPPCCPSTSLCICSQPACPLVNPCGSPPLPCLGQCCSSPSCIPCLLNKIQCFLDPCPVKPICPPIPPPCSIKSDSSDPGDESKKAVERTFHLPTCPLYTPPCGAHMSLKDQCPFSPNPCPVSCECPFPVSISLESNKNSFREQSVKKDDEKMKVSDRSSKTVKFDFHELEQKSEDGEKTESVEEDKNRDSNCPYSSSCGVVPLPTCPAAEILCPDIYVKPKKVKTKPCPFKKCMNTKGCPLSKLKPEVDCEIPNCPMTKDPDCPLGELVNKCQLFPKCSCTCSCSPSGCCSIPLPCPLNVPCECTSTDGHSPTFPHSSSDSGSTFSSSPSSYSFTTPSLINTDFLDSSKSNSQYSILNTSLASLLSIHSEKAAFDGCCCKNNYENQSQEFSESTASSECPFEPLAPKTLCQFAPPKCPLTPKPTTCPLTRKPDPCALSSGGKLICHIEYPPCKKFPSGRCPMGDVNICDCEYPVSPCMLPPQDTTVIAPQQYCFREDCCMGLPFPPSIHTNLKGEIDKGPFYQFRDTKPGKEETKHYVKISKEPLRGSISLFGTPRIREHNNWTVVRHGEGYLRCKTIAKKLEEMGPIRNFNSQYDSEDCPIDKETLMIIENRKKHERDVKELEILRMNLGVHPEEAKMNKKKNNKKKNKK